MKSSQPKHRLSQLRSCGSTYASRDEQPCTIHEMAKPTKVAGLCSASIIPSSSPALGLAGPWRPAKLSQCVCTAPRTNTILSKSLHLTADFPSDFQARGMQLRAFAVFYRFPQAALHKRGSGDQPLNASFVSDTHPDPSFNSRKGYPKPHVWKGKAQTKSRPLILYVEGWTIA